MERGGQENTQTDALDASCNVPMIKIHQYCGGGREVGAGHCCHATGATGATDDRVRNYHLKFLDVHRKYFC